MLVRLLGLLLTTAAASVVYAQEIIVGGRGFGGMAPRWPKQADFDGSFIYCRASYTSYGRGGWSTGYPGADNNFSVRLAELTRVRVEFDLGRQLHHVVVALTDPLLARCPMLFMEDIGTAQFSAEEA